MTGATPPRAHTATGRLLGEWNGETAVFRGIPFAAPPVGELRWQPPMRPQGWDGERPAREFGPAPLQPHPPADSVMYRTNFDDPRALVMSEDCLYLNVWTPEPSPAAGLPVMVWIHGGGNRYGHGSQSIHDGRAMACRGMVVVTLNYRLGALGFLAHPGLGEHSGNYGLHDILTALTWVQENIAAFGGDPGRVTLAGNSAGAAHICHLMASQAARSLFRAAIGHSASGIGRAEGPLPTQAEAQKQGLRYGDGLGGHDIDALRRLSGIELVVRGHFGPVIDGRVLAEASDDVFAAGRQHPVPLLVGTNSDEGSVYTPTRVPAGSGFERLYPAGDTRSAERFTGDSRFVYPVWHWARTHRATVGGPTRVYRFARRPPLPPELPGLGVYHTAELPYALDNLDRRPGWPWQDVDRWLAATMADAWARFVTSADPNGGTLPDWPVFTGVDDAPVMVFGGTVHVGVSERLAAMHLLDQLPRPF